MAEELKEGPWHEDLEDFMAKLFWARKNLAKGYWCCDFDVKYLTLRIDTRDLGYLVFADGRGDLSNASNKFRISPDAVRAAINKWQDDYHKQADLSATAEETASRSVDERDAVTLLRRMLVASKDGDANPKLESRLEDAKDWLARYDAKHPTQILR
jgi:hypothetical protein